MKKIIDLVGLSVAINNIKLWVQSLLGSKADSATTLAGYNITDAFTKTEVNTALEKKANTSDVYTKTQTDTAIATAITNKANKSTTLSGYGITDAYTKTETGSAITAAFNTFVADVSNDQVVNTYKELIDYAATHGAEFTTLVGEVGNKANKADVYTKEQVNTTITTALTGKANVATTLAGYGITDAYTKTEVTSLINNIDHFDNMMCFNNDIHLCNYESSTGGTIYFGDQAHDDDAERYVYISEYNDDELLIHAVNGITLDNYTYVNGGLVVSGSTDLNSTSVGSSKTSHNLTVNTKQLQLEFDGDMYLKADSSGNDPCTSYSITVQNLLSRNLIPIEYEQLVTLRDTNKLQPGRFYRITNYITRTTQSDTSSAKHQFDVIVLALSNNKLSEEAWAAQHEGDTYFSNSNLSAWKLWYCLDNDTSRFAWADMDKGQGVIYRMIDEFGNDCPYDFKNILFANAFYNQALDMYTFNLLVKDTIGIYSNFDASIKYPNNLVYQDGSTKYFKSNHICANNKIEYNISSWTQGSSNYVTYYKPMLYMNLFIYDALTIDGKIGPVNFYWVDNYINGTNNVFAQARGFGTSTKQISGNRLYNCHVVRNTADSNYVSGGSTTAQIIKNCVLHNINTPAAEGLYAAPTTPSYVIEENASNSLIVAGNILADNIYQSNT